MELIREPAATATETTKLINDAIEATRIGFTTNIEGGGTVLLAPGDYYIDSSIVINDIFGVTLSGAGHNTRLIWVGEAGGAIIDMSNTRNCRVKDLFIQVSSPAHAAIHLYNGGASVRSTQSWIENIWISGNAVLEQGIKIGGEGSIDANNDFLHFTNCWVTGYTYAGVTMEEASQSYNNMFTNCHLQAAAGGLYGVKTGNSMSGSFAWHGGGIMASGIADFHIGRSPQPTLIESMNSEGSRRLLQIPGTAYSLITMKSCRFAGSAIESGNDVLDLYFNSGVVNVEGCHFYSPNTPLTIKRRGNSGTLNFSGNMVMSPNYPDVSSLFDLANDLTVNSSGGNVLMDVGLFSVEF